MEASKFWGSATVGSKGQIVIPADAREALQLREGDKLLIMSPGGREALMVVRPAVLEQYMKRVQRDVQNALADEATGDKA